MKSTLLITAELAPCHAKVQDHRAWADGFVDHGWRAEIQAAWRAGGEKGSWLGDGEKKEGCVSCSEEVMRCPASSPHGATCCLCHNGLMCHQCTKRLKSHSADPGVTSSTRPTASRLSPVQHVGTAGSWPRGTPQTELQGLRKHWSFGWRDNNVWHWRNTCGDQSTL